MPLETASTIADLVSTNPVGASDTPAALDDHIRLIKTVLKADAFGASTVHAATGKTTPVDNDEIPLTDSAASYGKNKLTWANLKATLVATSNAWSAVQTYSAGSVSAPSIVATGDTNTGIWFPAADTIAVSTGGSERMRIDTSGNVTINTGASSGGLFLGSGDTNVGLYRATGTNTLSLRAGGGYLATLSETTGFTWQHITPIGYGTGAGGTVTQSTSKSTTVTMTPARPCGRITMNNASLAAGATVSFQFNNSLIASSDNVIINMMLGAGDPGYYNIWAGINSGYAQIYVRNISGSAQADAVTLSFSIIKGATS